MISDHSKPPYSDYQSGPLSPSFFRRTFPSIAFYQKMIRIVLKASHEAKRGDFDDAAWCAASLAIRDVFEECGAKITIENTRSFYELDEPCVFIGNHMSTAETFLLASIIVPKMPVTFVVKQGLVEYPIFKHIMLSRNPVVVGRENPREDLKKVMEDGVDRLQKGVSVVIFPQRTRAAVFNPDGFNSIGAKLARKAGVPIVPLALKTNAWQNGKRFKDFGPFVPSEDVHFKFGEPMRIEKGTGKAENEAVVRFVQENLGKWSPELIAPKDSN